MHSEHEKKLWATKSNPASKSITAEAAAAAAAAAEAAAEAEAEADAVEDVPKVRSCTSTARRLRCNVHATYSC